MLTPPGVYVAAKGILFLRWEETSPYPNHGEAQAAESQKDFIHKLRISLKELRETQRWLKLI